MSSFARSQPIPPISKSASPSSPFLTVRLFHFLATLADNHGWVLFAAVCLACGWGALTTMGTRHLNHDELFTFYIAQAPTLRQLLKLSHTVDLQPPLAYLLVRGSFAILGVSSWSCRLPFLLAYCSTAALMFYFLRRLLSPLYGLVATLLLWSNSCAYLAREARPYSILLCCTTLLLVSWYEAVSTEDSAVRRPALATVLLAGFGLLLSHVFGLLVYATFFLAEVLRFLIRRRTDWPLWLVLLLPLAAVVTYVPLLHNHSTMLFAEEYRVTPILLLSFYWESIRFLITPLAFIALLALLWPILRKGLLVTAPAVSQALSIPFGFLLIAFAFVPLTIGILFARMGTAFFNRYGVIWLVPLALGPPLILGYRSHRDRTAGVAAVLVLAVILFFNTAGKPWILQQVSNLVPPRTAAKLLYLLALPPLIPVHYPATPSYLQQEMAKAPFFSHLDSVAPELPMVANTGLTFVEVDRQESVQVAQRLYFLADEKAASAIAHDTVFAHYELVKQAFPVIRGTVEPYHAFIAAHPRFVVIGAYNNPQGWLLRKLDRDGAKLQVIGTCAGYSEDCQIYEVNVRPPQP
ncbi:MAG: ArnT family glycosyltransferase [Terriglobales bacterium]